MANQPYTPQNNNDASAACRNVGVPVVQKIASFTNTSNPYVAGQSTVINLPLVNVGLIKRLWVRVQANVSQVAAETHTAQAMGPANFLSQVVVTDLNNLVRVNTAGWHLSMLSTAKRQLAFGASFTSDSPFGFGSNYSLVKIPATLTTAQNLSSFYEIPLSYSDADLRGAMFANVTTASMNVQLTINPNLFQTSTGDAALSCFKSSTAQLGKINSYTIDVYQEYIDQLPRYQDGSYMLPLLDIATQYNVINTNATGMAVGADFSLPYAALRSYMSTFVMYDNAGVLNAGTDINYFALQSANSMNIFKYDPFVAQLLNGRNKINDDWPAGLYYFDHRAKPISTIAGGNTQLIVNPSSVGAQSIFNIGYEFFAMTQQLQQAGSITSQ
jgi:hypothetical protein